jgi:hypothetical protein
MSDKRNNRDAFFEGKLSVNEMLNSNLELDADNDFFEAYKKVITENANEQDAKFNPFKKIEAQKTKRISGIRKALSYAAIIVALVGFSTIYYYFNISGKRSPDTIQLAEAQQKTEQALLYFSKELNNAMRNFKEIKYEPQPVIELEKFEFEKIKIEFKNPIKNLDLN